MLICMHTDSKMGTLWARKDNKSLASLVDGWSIARTMEFFAPPAYGADAFSWKMASKWSLCADYSQKSNAKCEFVEVINVPKEKT